MVANDIWKGEASMERIPLSTINVLNFIIFIQTERAIEKGIVKGVV